MKRTLKVTFSLLLTLAFTLGLGSVALADDASVSYEGGAEQFVFLPGSEYTDTDLFDGFKGVMPGDTLTQKITVTNNRYGTDTVKIYMRAQVHGELTGNPLSEAVAAQETVVSMTDFLSQLSMTVKQGDTVLYQAAPNELDGLAQNVLLGSFASGESTELTVELKVPAGLGNQYAERIGEVDWVFTAEEIPAPTTAKPEQPKTGDTASLVLWIVLAGAALVLLAALAFARVRQSRAK